MEAFYLRHNIIGSFPPYRTAPALGAISSTMMLPQPIKPVEPTRSPTSNVPSNEAGSFLFRGPREEIMVPRAPSPLTDYDGLLSSPSIARSPVPTRTPSPALDSKDDVPPRVPASAPAMTDSAPVRFNPFETVRRRSPLSRSLSRSTTKSSVDSSSENGESPMPTFPKSNRPASGLYLPIDHTSKPPIESPAPGSTSRLSTIEGSLYTAGGPESTPVSALRNLHLGSPWHWPIAERAGVTRSFSPPQPPSPIYSDSWGSVKGHRQYSRPPRSLRSQYPPLSSTPPDSLPPDSPPPHHASVYVPPTPRFFRPYNGPDISPRRSPTPHPHPAAPASQFTPTPYRSHVPLPPPPMIRPMYPSQFNSGNPFGDSSSIPSPPHYSTTSPNPFRPRNYLPSSQTPLWSSPACPFIPPVIPVTPGMSAHPPLFPPGFVPQGPPPAAAGPSPWGQALPLASVKRHDRFYFEDGGFNIEVCFVLLAHKS